MARRMPNGKNARKFSELQRAQMSRLVGAVRWGQTWFKVPPPPKLTATRDVPRHFLGEAGPSRLDLPKDTIRAGAQQEAAEALAARRRQLGLDLPLPGTYEWAKAHAHESATAYVGLNLHRPSSTLNHRTARFAGKPYHWRQDYTGQLKLAAGESPW